MSETPPARRPRPWLRRLLLAGYVLGVGALILGGLEVAARAIGLGHPILYYNTVDGGMRPLPDQAVARVGGAPVTIDAAGFRSASTPAPGDTAALRVLYLGDSVTWGGSRTGDADTFPEVAADALRRSGRPVYAMNAAVNGASLLNAADVYAAEGGRADAVVWLFPWGDVTRAYLTLGPLHPARLAPRFALVELVDQVLFRFWVGAFRHDAGRDGDAGADFEVAQFPPGYHDLGRRELAARERANLAAARDVLADLQARGVPVIVGVTPTLVDGALAPLEPEAEAFLAEAAVAGAVVFDVAGAVRQAGGPDGLFLDALHFTTDGHRAVGEALGAALRTALPDTLR